MSLILNSCISHQFWGEKLGRRRWNARITLCDPDETVVNGLNLIEVEGFRVCDIVLASNTILIQVTHKVIGPEERAWVGLDCSTVKNKGAASASSAQTGFPRFMDIYFAYLRRRSTSRGCFHTILCDSEILIFRVWYPSTGVLHSSSLCLT